MEFEEELRKLVLQFKREVLERMGISSAEITVSVDTGSWDVSVDVYARERPLAADGKPIEENAEAWQILSRIAQLVVQYVQDNIMTVEDVEEYEFDGVSVVIEVI